MKWPWANTLLLILLVIQTVTGYFGLVNGRDSAAWILWLHGIVAYTLFLLIFFKAGIVLDTWRRKGRWTGRRIGFAVTMLLLCLTLLSGLVWTFSGPAYFGAFSLVSLHIYLAIPLMGLMLWHAWHMRFILRVKGATGRRLFLAGGTAAVSGLIIWSATRRLTRYFGLLGAARRFTGSYEAGSFSNSFPVVSWIADRPPPFDSSTWRLVVDGAVSREGMLTYAELAGLHQQVVTATLDCTGGWYTTQQWRGVSVSDLLNLFGLLPTAASVTFESGTGYKRRFDLHQAHSYVLALGTLHSGSQPTEALYLPLDLGHGYPIRLVAPDRRGLEWVKWVKHIQVNETGPGWQSPLPLQ